MRKITRIVQEHQCLDKLLWFAEIWHHWHPWHEVRFVCLPPHVRNRVQTYYDEQRKMSAQYLQSLHQPLAHGGWCELSCSQRNLERLWWKSRNEILKVIRKLNMPVVNSSADWTGIFSVRLVCSTLHSLFTVNYVHSGAIILQNWRLYCSLRCQPDPQMFEQQPVFLHSQLETFYQWWCMFECQKLERLFVKHHLPKE